MRKDKRYWGPVLIVIGLTLAGIAAFMLREDALWWALSVSALLVIAGGVLVAAARQNA
jgi:hypothetical protein